MIYLKMFCLAAVAAVVVTALLGAGSASATVLCEKNEIPCLAENLYLEGQEISAALEAESSTTLKTTSGQVFDACEASTMSMITKNTGGKEERVEGEKSFLFLGECSSPTTLVKSGEFSLEYVFSEPTNTRGNLWISEIQISVTFVGQTCAYGGGVETFVGTAFGGKPAVLSVKTVLSKVMGGVLCPGDVVWEGNYEITQPKDLYFKEEAK